MKTPNLLATKWGRLSAFFFLYMTEGIPLGFTATAIATQMRREGVGPAAIGAFVGSLYLPWALKFMFGPFVDVLSSDRWGRRRTWIFAMQLGMIATLLIASPVSFSSQIKLFTLLILVHNAFGATQDVAIDALAVGTLKESERGLANGLMFAGANIGQAVGGSAVLFLTAVIPFQSTFWFVAGCIACVTIFITFSLKEPKTKPPSEGPVMKAAAREIKTFVRDAYIAFIGTRAAFVGLFFAILPAGPMALGLALQSNLAVELGLNDNSVGWLNLWSTIVSAAGCVVGGMLSDKLGRKRMLAIYVAGMAPATLYLMQMLSRHQWIMPIDPNMPNRPVVPVALVSALWIATMVYSLFNGLMYGTRTALFMDVTTPAVAATQFTAYMALLNLSISYSATWQGVAVEAFGYPKTLLVDALFGLVSLSLLPLMKRPREGAAAPASAAAARARMLAAALGGVMIVWILHRSFAAQDSKLAPLWGTFFTIALVITGMYLVGSVGVIGNRLLGRLSMIAGVLTLLVHAFRFHADTIGGWMGLDPAGGWGRFTNGYVLAAPAFAAIVLFSIAAGADLIVTLPEPPESERTIESLGPEPVGGV